MDTSIQIQELSFAEIQEVSGGSFIPLMEALIEGLFVNSVIDVYNLDWGEASYEDMMLAP